MKSKEEQLEEDFIPEVDIKDMKLVSRVSFDMDSIKELEKTRKIKKS